MKKMKKILTLMLTVCLLLPCFSTIALAVGGVVFFTDLETAVGETFQVTGTVVTKDDTIGDATIKLTYDTTYLRFVEGEGITVESDGNLVFNGSGDRNSDRITFDMKFQALKEGSTRIGQGETKVTNSDGAIVSCEEGYSDIAIAEGDPSLIAPEVNGDPIEVNGVEYHISESFSAAIPSGFVAGDVTYQEKTYKGIVQNQNDIQGLYLVDSEKKGAFFLYNKEKDSFYPCEEIIISEMYSIIILDDTTGVDLGSDYMETSISINNVSFPAWIENGNNGFCVLRAINSDGEKALYTYDSIEHTYQRMDEPKTIVVEAKDDKPIGKWNEFSGFIYNNLLWIAVCVACVFVVMAVLLIVLAVKLRRRNLELDDLYDEYHIDVDEYSEDQTDEYEEEYEEEEAFDDSSSDDFDEEDDMTELRSSLDKKESVRNKNYDAYYDDDDFEDDFDDEYSDESEEEIISSVNSDTFEMDFIEFD